MVWKFALLTAAAAALFAAPPLPPAREGAVVVHEWGTFTSVASRDGMSARWMPFSGAEDVPDFVNRLNYCRSPKDGIGFARIRMETPVLYFYSAQPALVSVKVSFPAGLITEWFPPASKVNGATLPGTRLGENRGYIQWTDVQIDPLAKPELKVEQKANHYYAARGADASPLEVNGQWENMLFYRGIADFPPPVQAALAPDDTKVTLTATTGGRIPVSILFERRGDRAGFRRLDAGTSPMDLAMPQLDGDVARLRTEMEELLVKEGLFAKEAHAMVETWKDSWFQDGSRIFYLVPQAFTNEALPINVSPAPAELRRVFVGRIELMTKWANEAVRTAVKQDDATEFAKWSRFLDPLMRENGGQYPSFRNANAIRAVLAANQPNFGACRQ